MNRIVGLGLMMTLVSVSRGMAQEVPALIEKLLSQDPDLADRAREDLLRQGPKAIGALREAAERAQDPTFKKSLSQVADRIETRRAVGGLAKAWGDRWYSVFVDGLQVGWLHLRTQEKDGKILLDSEIRLQMGKDVSFRVKAALTCEPNEYLTATSIGLDVATPEKSVAATAQLKEGRLVIRAEGNVTAQKVRPNTVVDLAVFPLVTVLPKTEGLDLEVLELIKPKLPESALLKFDKEESIERAGRGVRTRRFLLASQGKERFYWVDASGQLLQVQFTGDDQKAVEILLSDETRAKDIDTKD